MTENIDSKDQLVAAAKRLFSQKGLDGTTVRELADEAGVNVSMVSYYFDGKEGLYRYCLESFGKDRLSMAERILQPPTSREELKVRVEMFVDEMMAGFLSEPELFHIIQGECDRGLPIAEDIFRRTFLKVAEALMAFVKAAQKAKIIRDSVDPFISATLVMGMLIHTMRLDRTAERFFGTSLKEPKHREKVKQQIIGMFLEGVSL